MKKSAVVFGITGGIGGAIGRVLLKENWEVFGIGRNYNKLKKFKEENFGVTLLASKLRDEGETLILWKEIFKKTSKIDLIILAAGNISVDSKFFGETVKEKEANAIIGLINDNFLTKLRIDKSFRKIFNPKETIIVVISSHAANFLPIDPRRKNEEGYVISMKLVSDWARNLKTQESYKSVILEEPGLINTKRVFESLNKETIGVDLNPDDGKDENDYALEVYNKILE